MQKKLLFNPLGSDDTSARLLVGGSTTNLIQLSSVRYKWATALYDRMLNNFWIPQKVDLTTDSSDYGLLTTDERRAYNGVLSFLVFLDSLQVSNLPRIADYITAPEVSLALSVHSFQETIHAQSYAYLIESLLGADDREVVYDFWRSDKVLLTRNSYIAGIFQDFSNEASSRNFFKVLIANLLLESVYFYNGFTFFYSLASRHLMGGTADIIKYIHRDELTHAVVFKNIIRDYLEQNTVVDYAEIIQEMVHTAVEQEIAWTNHILGNNILGINYDSTDIHTKYLANTSIKTLGLAIPPLFPDSKYQVNPYLHLEKMSDTRGGGEVKANFFEQTVTEYSMSSSVKGWDF